MKRFTLFVSLGIAIVVCVVIGYFLVGKYQLGMIRYFDMDEFAYLNWASHMTQGFVPYRDFLYQLPPGFLLMLTPIFIFSRSSLSPLTQGRVVAFVIQCLLIVIIGLIFWRVRKRWTALFASLFLAFLPLPADKLLEIRPDTAGVLFAMVGTLFQIMWMEREKGKIATVFMGISGLFYGLSVFVLQKTVFHVAVAAGIAYIWALQIKPWFTRVKMLLPFVIGGISPFIPFVFWAVTQHSGSLTWYLLTKFPSETMYMAKDFYISPWFFFRYTDVYYGKSGWNWGYLLNQIIWVVGILMGIVRFVTPVIPRGKKYVLSELLLSGVFLVQLLTFIYYMPFKHAQYLIPLAVFVALYAADFIDVVWQRMTRSAIILGVGTSLLLVLVGLLIQGYRDVNDIKMNWTNTHEKQTLQTMLDTIPRNEYVFDLVGLSLYYPQPYYVSCLPVGQFSRYISLQLPSLRDTLERTKTRYIYQGNAKRLTTLLPEDQAYISAHYIPVGDGSLLQRGK
ncbi:MAG: hypothetical protein V1917_01040 [Candidatus Gottesmanbacteria bacterium]